MRKRGKPNRRKSFRASSSIAIINTPDLDSIKCILDNVCSDKRFISIYESLNKGRTVSASEKNDLACYLRWLVSKNLPKTLQVVHTKNLCITPQDLIQSVERIATELERETGRSKRLRLERESTSSVVQRPKVSDSTYSYSFPSNSPQSEKIEKTGYFIITSGPTGAGKTRLMKKTLEYLKLTENEGYTKENIETLLIDDYVENDPYYKMKILKKIHEIEQKCQDECKNRTATDIDQCTSECEKEKYSNPAQELYKYFRDEYYKVRKSDKTTLKELYDADTLKDNDKYKNLQQEMLNKYDMSSARDEVDRTNDNYDGVLDKKLEALAMERGIYKKIIIFEITGENNIGWLLNDKFINERYNIVMSNVFVSIDKLVQRNQSRAYDAVQKIKMDTNKPAPRLPNVTREEIHKKVMAIKNKIIEYYSNCVLKNQHEKELCGDRSDVRVLIFDNNEEITLVYDSFENKSIQHLENTIDKIIHLSN